MPEAIKISIQGLDKLRAAFKKAPSIVRDQVQRAINFSVAMVNRNVKEEVPVRTGRLRAGIRSSYAPFRGMVESTAAYGVFVHEGTKAHIIKPVRKKALYWKGAAHPVRSVQHPGTKANPFMTRGAERSEAGVQAQFQIALNNVADQLAL